MVAAVGMREREANAPHGTRWATWVSGSVSSSHGAVKLEKRRLWETLLKLMPGRSSAEPLVRSIELCEARAPSGAGCPYPFAAVASMQQYAEPPEVVLGGHCRAEERNLEDEVVSKDHAIKALWSRCLAMQKKVETLTAQRETLQKERDVARRERDEAYQNQDEAEHDLDEAMAMVSKQQGEMRMLREELDEALRRPGEEPHGASQEQHEPQEHRAEASRDGVFLDVSDMTTDELRAECLCRGLPADGSLAGLRLRVRRSRAEDRGGRQPHSDEPGLAR